MAERSKSKTNWNCQWDKRRSNFKSTIAILGTQTNMCYHSNVNFNYPNELCVCKMNRINVSGKWLGWTTVLFYQQYFQGTPLSLIGTWEDQLRSFNSLFERQYVHYNHYNEPICKYQISKKNSDFAGRMELVHGGLFSVHPISNWTFNVECTSFSKHAR